MHEGIVDEQEKAIKAGPPNDLKGKWTRPILRAVRNKETRGGNTPGPAETMFTGIPPS